MDTEDDIFEVIEKLKRECPYDKYDDYLDSDQVKLVTNLQNIPPACQNCPQYGQGPCWCVLGNNVIY